MTMIVETAEEAASICSTRDSSLAEMEDQEILKEVDYHHYYVGTGLSFSKSLSSTWFSCHCVSRWRSIGQGNDQPVERKPTGGLTGEVRMVVMVVMMVVMMVVGMVVVMV